MSGSGLSSERTAEAGNGTLRVGCIQLRSGLSRDVNLRAVAALIETAAQEGATLIATPEMTNIVDRKPDRFFAELTSESPSREIAFFSALAARLSIWLLIGSIALRDDEAPDADASSGMFRARNRSLLFTPEGQLAAIYDKIHMFDVDLPGGESWRESAVYAAGDHAVLARTAGPGSSPSGMLGLTICYDVRFPALYRTLAQAGANILTVPAAFTAQTGKVHWEPLLRARAIETGSFVIAPAQGGQHEDRRQTHGHSLIIDPWGQILAELDHDAPGILIADLDLSAAQTARSRIPNLTLERPFTVHTYQR